MSGLQAWAEDHVGVSIEFGGTPWCLEAVQDGRAVLRKEAPPGVCPEAERVRAVPLATVYTRYLRQNGSTSSE